MFNQRHYIIINLLGLIQSNHEAMLQPNEKSLFDKAYKYVFVMNMGGGLIIQYHDHLNNMYSFGNPFSVFG